MGPNSHDFAVSTKTIMSILIQETMGFRKLLTGAAWDNSQTSNIESNKSQNSGLEDYNNISDGIFPHFTTPSIKISLG